MTTHQVQVRGALLRYDVRGAGDGPPVVLLPGWCCPRSDWYGVVDELGSVRSATLDLPGQGASTDGGHPWSIADLGSAVAAVLDRLGWRDVVLVGHSMGGAAAVEAARASDRVASIVAVDALTYETLYPTQSEEVIRATLAPLEADWEAGMTALVTALFVDPSSPLVPRIARSMAATPVASGLRSLRALMEWDRDAALATCEVPVDVLATSEFLDAEAVRRLPAAVTVHASELGGHFYLLDRPAETARLLRGLLDA